MLNSAILKLVKKEYRDIKILEADQFYWSPEEKIIYYDKTTSGNLADLALLHEISHAKLGHTNYKSDFDLLSLEVSAWHETRKMASELGVMIDENHIEDCLDSYRDWIAKRSACPVCGLRNLQLSDSDKYSCYNCHSIWKVSSSRFCRPYRSKI